MTGYIYLKATAVALVMAVTGRPSHTNLTWEGDLTPALVVPAAFADQKMDVPCGVEPKKLQAVGSCPSGLCLPFDTTPKTSLLEAACIQYGNPDLNADGLVDSTDAVLFQQALNGGGDPNADLNGDGSINAGDAAIFIPLLGGVVVP